VTEYTILTSTADWDFTPMLLELCKLRFSLSDMDGKLRLEAIPDA
jgi:hypothetical protein